MKISVLCSHQNHPVYPQLVKWVERQSTNHTVELVDSKSRLSGGSLLFLISCHEIVGADVRARYESTLVIHASDLPKGRGWSPHIWQVLGGESRITVSLLEAADAVDSGAIWAKRVFDLEGHELWDEINAKLFAIELELMDFAVDNFGRVNPELQTEESLDYFPKRTPQDSQLDPDKSLGEQFNLLRVCDPDRFPAYFELNGHNYRVIIQKHER